MNTHTHTRSYIQQLQVRYRGRLGSCGGVVRPLSGILMLKRAAAAAAVLAAPPPEEDDVGITLGCVQARYFRRRLEYIVGLPLLLLVPVSFTRACVRKRVCYTRGR